MLNRVKTVVVAGAAGSLGQHLVKELLKQRRHVVSLCRTELEKRSLDDHLANLSFAPSHHLVLTGDLANAHDVAAMTKQAGESLGSIDALINAAGTFRYRLIEDSTEDDYRTLFDSNLKSCWLLSRSVIGIMKRASFGRIIFVSSHATKGVGDQGVSLYLASKGAINFLTTCLAKELSICNITVNAVLPTVIDTPANRDAMPQEDFSRWVPLSSLGGAIVSLLSDEMGGVTGSLISVPGRI
ncbi:MAG: SDR family oxidoreductase [Deltaproteobacteria bacterium]|nr:SDR family oxidoreductase [Deltaproteobacteria bacterium]